MRQITKNATNSTISCVFVANLFQFFFCIPFPDSNQKLSTFSISTVA